MCLCVCELFYSASVCVSTLQMTYHGVLLVELGSGLSFPATEHLSRVLHSQALLGKASSPTASLGPSDGSQLKAG